MVRLRRKRRSDRRRVTRLTATASATGSKVHRRVDVVGAQHCRQAFGLGLRPALLLFLLCFGLAPRVGCDPQQPAGEVRESSVQL